jgi:hypothetical protein
MSVLLISNKKVGTGTGRNVFYFDLLLKISLDLIPPVRTLSTRSCNTFLCPSLGTNYSGDTTIFGIDQKGVFRVLLLLLLSNSSRIDVLMVILTNHFIIHLGRGHFSMRSFDGCMRRCNRSRLLGLGGCGCRFCSRSMRGGMGRGRSGMSGRFGSRVYRTACSGGSFRRRSRRFSRGFSRSCRFRNASGNLTSSSSLVGSSSRSGSARARGSSKCRC